MEKEIKRKSMSLLEDTISGLLGDPIALAWASKTILSSPFFIREHLFWHNFERFLRGLDFYLGDKIRFSEKISADGKEKENAKRIIALFDKVDSDEKVEYIINVSRALCVETIELSKFFRLIQAISETLIEDLVYLKNNIRKENIPYDLNVFSLSQRGLAYQSVIGENGVFDFTDLGISVVCFGIEYDKLDCNKDLLSKLGFPISVSTGIEEVTEDEFQRMFDEKFSWREL